MKTEIISEHLWKYFELHSQQRLTLFNYYIAVSGALISAIGFCLHAEKDLNFLVIALSFLLIIFSFLFYKLDQRTSFLIKRCEKCMVILEQNINSKDINLFTEDNVDLNISNNGKFFNKILTYGFIFRLAYFLISMLSFIFIIYIGVYLKNG